MLEKRLNKPEMHRQLGSKKFSLPELKYCQGKKTELEGNIMPYSFQEMQAACTKILSRKKDWIRRKYSCHIASKKCRLPESFSDVQCKLAEMVQTSSHKSLKFGILHQLRICINAILGHNKGNPILQLLVILISISCLIFDHILKLNRSLIWTYSIHHWMMLVSTVYMQAGTWYLILLQAYDKKCRKLEIYGNFTSWKVQAARIPASCIVRSNYRRKSRQLEVNDIFMNNSGSGHN